MRRREFLGRTAAGAAALRQIARATESELLLPSDAPDEFHFRMMWHNPVPPIDKTKWRLDVSGMVDKPEQFSLADLRKLPQEEQSSRLKCVQCWSSRTNWGGFRIGHLLELVKPQKGAKAVRIDCADKWYEHFTLEEMQSQRLMLVLDMGGKPLADRHGAPLRIIDPARYGYKSAKLVTAITFVPEAKGSMACDIGPYYTAGGDILAGIDHPLDIDPKARRRILGGEITDY